MCVTLKKVVMISLIVLCTISTLPATIGDRDYLPSRPTQPLLPIDSAIGKIVEITSDPLLERCSEAFSTPWSAEWVSTYVEPSVRSIFTHTWDKTLAQLLPVENLLCGLPVGDSDVRTIPVRLFLPENKSSTVFSLSWQFSETDGQWYLVAMTKLD